MSEYTFQKIRWQIHPKVKRYEERWFLKITDLIHFMDFLDWRSKKLMGAYFQIKKRYPQVEGHYVGEDQYAVGWTLALSKEPRESILDDVRVISDKLLSGYYHFYNAKGYLFINENGSITPIDDYKVLEEQKSQHLVWPGQKLTEKDIRIIRWPQGKHFYAKIGSVEVKDADGNIKWNTEKEADRQAHKFLERITHGSIQQNKTR